MRGRRQASSRAGFVRPLPLRVPKDVFTRTGLASPALSRAPDYESGAIGPIIPLTVPHSP